jgi:hypothetical protein
VAESTLQNISSRVMPFSQESEDGDFSKDLACGGVIR